MRMPWSIIVVLLAAGVSAAAEPAEMDALPLVHNGKPACTLVVIQSDESAWLIDHAAETIISTVKRWTGVDLPQVRIDKQGGSLPSGPAIVLGTLDGLARFAPECKDAGVPAAFVNEHGFACVPLRTNAASRFVVTGPSSRSVFNGAICLRDFRIDGSKSDLSLHTTPIIRTPQLAGRAVYLLTIWGHEARYTADNWITIFDSFARDGFDRVYFWFSGHFPSKKYPQTYKCKDGPWDSTVESGIPTIEDQRKIIRAAHDRSLKIYLGGALGGWVGTRFLTNEAPGTMKTPPKGASYEGKYSLCPSSPASRNALIEYYAEMFDALPEADGVFIESADEWGGCVCADCGNSLDKLGSTQFGQAQLSLLQEIMAGIWRNHPHARVAYTIGYDEHRKDPAYYRLIRQMNDPRIEWMEARNSWSFPGPDGSDRPARTFSRQVMRWRQYYGQSLDNLVQDANRVGSEGWYGLITAFEPGAGTGDFYRDIPYPTDIMPYVLTGFVWREMTWEPLLTRAQMLDRVRQRFFGREADSQLAEDLWFLREILRESAGGKLSPANRDKLASIEAHAAEARASAGPKTAETLHLIARAVADIRKHTAGSAK
jgi:hypothetical protein